MMGDVRNLAQARSTELMQLVNRLKTR